MSGGKVEWYKQVQTLTEWTIGRTADLAKVQMMQMLHQKFQSTQET